MPVRKITFFLVTLFVVLFVGTAQVTHATIGDNDISFEVNPEIPGPRQQVTITATSYSVDLNKAQITWKENNISKKSATGAKSYSFITGAVGTISTIDIVISVPGEADFKRRILINPGTIDLLVQALDAYVPPFYKGRAIAPQESLVRVVAVPAIKQGTITLSPADLVFTWKRDNSVVGDFSGYGQNAYTFTTNVYKASEDISVVADSVIGSYEAQGVVTVTPRNPTLLFYAYNPLVGTLWNKSLGASTQIPGTAFGILAEPYFFSPKKALATDLSFAWKLDGNTLDTPVRKNRILLTRDAKTNGTTTISLTLTQTKKMFQEITKNLTVSY
jgi:hypothetical protein